MKIIRAIYKFACSLRTFAYFLADLLLKLGFNPPSDDPNLWIKLLEHHDGYNYIGVFVYDILVIAKKS